MTADDRDRSAWWLRDSATWRNDHGPAWATPADLADLRELPADVRRRLAS